VLQGVDFDHSLAIIERRACPLHPHHPISTSLQLRLPWAPLVELEEPVVVAAAVGDVECRQKERAVRVELYYKVYYRTCEQCAKPQSYQN
jgi:hypothetical protein